MLFHCPGRPCIDFPLLLAAAPLKREERGQAGVGGRDFPLLLAAAPLKQLEDKCYRHHKVLIFRCF